MASKSMTFSRRHIARGGGGAGRHRRVAARLGRASVLKISIGSGGTIDDGDFRDRVYLKFAAEVEKRTNGASGRVYQLLLMKTVPRFDAVRRARST